MNKTSLMSDVSLMLELDVAIFFQLQFLYSREEKN